MNAQIFSFFVWLLLAVALASDARADGALVSVSRSVGWESDVDGVGYRTNAPWSARAGWAFANIDCLVEFATYSRVDGEPGGEIALTERQASFWVRKVFWTSFFAKPFAGAAAGARFEQTRERFKGEVEESDGQPRWLAVAAGGAIVPIAWGLVGEVEARLVASPGYAPNPQMAASAGLGWRF